MTSALADRTSIERHRDPVVDAAIAGDDRAFAVLVGRHRGELHGHCFRMLRSSERAEDVVQEALLRAWRSRSNFAGRSTFRTWLYRIATNACLDEMRRDRSRPRRQLLAADRAVDDGGQLPLDVAASTEPGPYAVVEAQETLERAFLAVIELLPPKQRAVLILCEVMCCPAGEVATLLGTSAAAVNSALQRARATLGADRPPAPESRPDPVERALLGRYVDALRRHDATAVIALARADSAPAAGR